MRRLTFLLVAAGSALVAWTGTAWGTPVVTFKSEFAPIAGFPNSGNILRAGAATHVEYSIGGTEYDGTPPPIVGINLYLPAGTTLHPNAFPTCAKSVLETTGPSGCTVSSEAGPVGSVSAFVEFGGERPDESLTWQSLYAEGGGLEFFLEGHSPALLGILASGHYATPVRGRSLGPELIMDVPLTSTEPGAPYTSFKTINAQWGSAFKPLHGPVVYYLRVPKKCPEGGFPFETEVTFDNLGGSPETVTATYTAPCPVK